MMESDYGAKSSIASVSCLYARRDRAIFERFSSYIGALAQYGDMSWWHSEMLEVGSDVKLVTMHHLQHDDIFILLITPDFLADRQEQADFVLSRHKERNAFVVPILFRPTPLPKEEGFVKEILYKELRIWPHDGEALSQKPDMDAAFNEAADMIKKILNRYQNRTLFPDFTRSNEGSLLLNGALPEKINGQDFLQSGEADVTPSANLTNLAQMTRESAFAGAKTDELKRSGDEIDLPSTTALVSGLVRNDTPSPASERPSFLKREGEQEEHEQLKRSPSHGGASSSPADHKAQEDKRDGNQNRWSDHWWVWVAVGPSIICWFGIVLFLWSTYGLSRPGVFWLLFGVLTLLMILVLPTPSGPIIGLVLPGSFGRKPDVLGDPPGRELLFTGRQDYLDQLEQGFVEAEKAGLMQTQIISGIGKIGKTAVALEYLERCRNRHNPRYLFWIDGCGYAEADRASLNAVQICERILEILAPLKNVRGHLQYDLKGQEALKEVRGWLAERLDWLIVIDNCKNWNVVEDIILPQQKRRFLLITQAATELVGGRVRLHHLDGLEKDEGAALLVSYLENRKMTRQNYIKL